MIPKILVDVHIRWIRAPAKHVEALIFKPTHCVSSSVLSVTVLLKIEGAAVEIKFVEGAKEGMGEDIAVNEPIHDAVDPLELPNTTRSDTHPYHDTPTTVLHHLLGKSGVTALPQFPPAPLMAIWTNEVEFWLVWEYHRPPILHLAITMIISPLPSLPPMCSSQERLLLTYVCFKLRDLSALRSVSTWRDGKNFLLRSVAFFAFTVEIILQAKRMSCSDILLGWPGLGFLASNWWVLP